MPEKPIPLTFDEYATENGVFGDNFAYTDILAAWLTAQGSMRERAAAECDDEALYAESKPCYRASARIRALKPE